MVDERYCDEVSSSPRWQRSRQRLTALTRCFERHIKSCVVMISAAVTATPQEELFVILGSRILVNRKPRETEIKKRKIHAV